MKGIDVPFVLKFLLSKFCDLLDFYNRLIGHFLMLLAGLKNLFKNNMFRCYISDNLNVITQNLDDGNSHIDMEILAAYTLVLLSIKIYDFFTSDIRLSANRKITITIQLVICDPSFGEPVIR